MTNKRNWNLEVHSLRQLAVHNVLTAAASRIAIVLLLLLLLLISDH
jgi:hypothetical protein